MWRKERKRKEKKGKRKIKGKRKNLQSDKCY